MKKILILMLLMVGCASTQTEVPKPTPEPQIEQECVDLTPEYLAEMEEHEANLESLSKFLENEQTELVAYFTVMSGTVSDVTFKDKVFVNNYEVALVHAEIHQKNKLVGSLFMIVAKVPSEWGIIGMFTAGEIKSQMESNVKEHLGDTSL